MHPFNCSNELNLQKVNETCANAGSNLIAIPTNANVSVVIKRANDLSHPNPKELGIIIKPHFSSLLFYFLSFYSIDSMEFLLKLF
jgi:hypothetical protein